MAENKQKSYLGISRPFDERLKRGQGLVVETGGPRGGSATISPEGVGSIADTPIKSTKSFSDVWIDKKLRSRVWKPKTRGFYIDGETGYAEFTNVYISGNITASSITGSTLDIGTDAWHVDSSGNMWWGSASTYAGASGSPRVSAAGSVEFTDGTFSGSIEGASVSSPDIDGATITSSTISSTTITGGTIRTASSGERIEITDSDLIKWFNSSGSGLGQILVSGSSTILFQTLDTTDGSILILGGSDASVSLSISGSGAYFRADGLLGYNVASQDITPGTDNTHQLGSTSGGNLRWADVKSVLINGADIGLENGWKFREWPARQEDVGKPKRWMEQNAASGIQVRDDEENLVAVVHKNGFLYCRGVKAIGELPESVD